eukprot:jgi/Galph1/1234/GphlegSOOS_G6037.1
MFSSFYKSIPGENGFRTGVYEKSSASVGSSKSLGRFPSLSSLSRSSPSSFSLSSASPKSSGTPKSPSSRSSDSAGIVPELPAKVQKYFKKHKKNIFEVTRLAVRLTRGQFPNAKDKRKKQEEVFSDIIEELENLVSDEEQELLRETLSCTSRELRVILDYVDQSIVENDRSKVFPFFGSFK